MSESTDKPTYVVDQDGSMSPEVKRIMEVHGIVHKILHHAQEIGDGLVGLRFAGHELNRGAEQDVEKMYTFSSEAACKEELFRIADYISKLNTRVLCIARTLGTQADVMASKLEIKEDAKVGKDLEEYLKTAAIGDPE